MGNWKFRLLVSFGLSVLLLPLAAILQPDLSNRQVLGLLALGSLTSIFLLSFRVFLLGVGLCSAFLSIWMVGPLAPWLTQRLITPQNPQAADLIVVLGGGIQCGAGQLEASSLGRLVKGLELWSEGYAPRISLSDTVSEIFGDPNCPSVGKVAKKLTEALYPQLEPEILLLPKMRTTRTEALAVAEIVRQKGYTKVLLVTAPTHTRRACGTFRQLGLEVVCVAAYEPRYDFTLRKPWDRWQALTSVTREYLGLALYGWRGWL